jgi:hypothetical protein
MIDGGRRDRYQGGVGDVEMEEADGVVAVGTQGLLGSLAPLDVARADQDGKTTCGKGPGRLQPDALVGSSDQGNLLRHATRVSPF